MLRTYKMKWIYLALLVILIAVAVVTMRRRKPRREGLGQLIETSNPTVIGGTTASKITFTHPSGHSTDVVKLNGDSDKTIVFIHNTPFNQEVWYPLYMLAQKYKNAGKKIPTMYCYDLRGTNTGWVSVPERYNDSDMSNYYWSFDELTFDLYEIYGKYIKDRKVTIVGYGTGGSVAQAFGLRYPELVEEMYILSTTIGPTQTGIPDETEYLVRWLAQHLQVTYLTMEESFVRWNMCLWFENNNRSQCPDEKNAADATSHTDTVEYLLAEKMYRTGNCATYLQMDKLVASEDLRPVWRTAEVPFPITFLIGDRDHYTNIDTMKEDMKIVKGAAPRTTLVIVKGKHGFPMMNTDYLYDLVTGKDVKNDPRTINVLNSF